jgi:hypothetical protein
MPRRFGFIPEVWPHQAAFPFRGRLLLVGCLLSALPGSLSAGLTLPQRGLPFVAAFTGFANAFFYCALFVRLLGMIPVIGRFLLLLIFYACFVSVSFDVVEVLIGAIRYGLRSSPHGRCTYLCQSHRHSVWRPSLTR